MFAGKADEVMKEGEGGELEGRAVVARYAEAMKSTACCERLQFVARCIGGRRCCRLARLRGGGVFAARLRQRFM